MWSPPHEWRALATSQPTKRRPPAGRTRQAETVRMAEEAPSSDADDVRRVKPLVAALDLELDELSLGEGLETLHGDGGEMHEHILPTLLLNEAVPLGVIEPLDLPPGHQSVSCYVKRSRTCTAFCRACR